MYLVVARHCDEPCLNRDCEAHVMRVGFYSSRPPLSCQRQSYSVAPCDVTSAPATIWNARVFPRLSILLLASSVGRRSKGVYRPVRFDIPAMRTLALTSMTAAWIIVDGRARELSAADSSAEAESSRSPSGMHRHRRADFACAKANQNPFLQRRPKRQLSLQKPPPAR